MEDNNKMLQETLNKAKTMMNFKPGMTRTELNEQGMAGPPASYMKQRQAKTAEPNVKKDNRLDRNAEYDLNRESGMSRKDAKGIKRDQRKMDKAARRGSEPAVEPNVDELPDSGEVRDYKHIDRFVRSVHRNAQDLDNDYKKLANSTFKGQNALEAAKGLYRQKYNEELPIWRDYIKGPEQPKQASTYTPKFPLCKGGVNKVGCRSNAVAQVQALVGGIDGSIKIDGMFGPKTKAALEKVAPEFAEQFTDADVATIKQKVNAPVEAPAPVRQPAPTKISTKGFPKPVDPMANLKPDRIPNPKALGEQDGPTNMAMGFDLNESISQKERARINKENRKKIKLGITS